jgi:serine/threonine protein kinase
VAGRYRIIRFIAQGGMGEVYEAKDLELMEKVALKTVRPQIAQHPGILERFKREIQLARKVTHPNVCRIFDLGHHRAVVEGQEEMQLTFLTMELLQGETLRERIKRVTRIPPAQALPIIRQMAAALATAHEASIIHRDFKSSNVVLTPSKTGERVVVTDFGLARGAAQSENLEASLTSSADVMGTPAYMAPEQLEGGEIGPAADVYALGVVIYEMVTGRWPYTGETPLKIAVRRGFGGDPSQHRRHGLCCDR